MGAGKWGDELCCEVNSYLLASFRIFSKYFRTYKISLGPFKNYKKKLLFLIFRTYLGILRNISKHHFLGQDYRKKCLAASTFTLNLIGSLKIRFGRKYQSASMLWAPLGYFYVYFEWFLCLAQIQSAGAFYGLPNWFWRWRLWGIFWFEQTIDFVIC